MRHVVVLVAVSLLAAACFDNSGDTPEAATDADAADDATRRDANSNDEASNERTSSDNRRSGRQSAPPPEFTIRPGVEQIAVLDAEPGRSLTVFGPDGSEVTTGTVDEFGSLMFRDLLPAPGWSIGDDTTRSDPVAVLTRDDHPDQAFYAGQLLPTDDLGYITTRDGTTLSANVWLPGPADDGPYPTVIEYSGYDPSDPAAVGFPDLFVGLGFAYVGVNVRGTGCSGGAFAYFEAAQGIDGYDVIETVAAQPWVLGGRVGMVGISYSGISQLFVAPTQPPSLAAIAPFSVIADSYRSTLYPGGLLNTGFAVPWANERNSDARPGNREWAKARIDAGDTECADNQRLRLQNVDLVQQIVDHPYWGDGLIRDTAPYLGIERITVPTFVAGSWQDERTGSHFATMLDQFTGTEHLYVSLVNGLHGESLSPPILDRWVEFLSLYVAEQTPTLDRARSLLPILGPGVFGTDDLALPTDDRFAGMTHEAALAAFESEPTVVVHFEQGAADGHRPGAPMARFTERFTAWPVPEAETTTLFLDGDGALADSPGEAGSTTRYLAVPDGVEPTWYAGTDLGLWRADAVDDWQRPGNGTFAEWTSPPLADDLVIVGSSSVDLWLQSNLGDTDLEVTISEIRPDGWEQYVQSGWLRASHRTLDDEASTDLLPVHTHAAGDISLLPVDTFELVRVAVLPVAHAFRAGSRIRLTVDAPGGNRALWEFGSIVNGEQVTIAHDAIHPSRLVVPVVPGIDVPDEYPACDALRGQPCRPLP